VGGEDGEAAMLTDRRGSEMAEAAVTLPVVIMVLLFVINGSLAGYSAMAAAGAANEGARMGAVAHSDPEGAAVGAALESIHQSGAGGTFTVGAKADKEPGGGVQVWVSWSYPSMLSGLCNFFGGKCPDHFGGVTTAMRKREGW
jgi:Flp pilus assembly protein TadG